MLVTQLDFETGPTFFHTFLKVNRKIKSANGETPITHWVRFQVLTAAGMKMTVFWNTAP
jgi:hypothetical protein